MGKHWTPEALAEFDCRYPGELTAELARDLGRTVPALYHRAKLRGIGKSEAFFASPNSGRTNGQRGMSSRFLPGHTPANKGIIGWQAGGRSVETQFKKGQKSINELPVGSHRRTTKERHWCRKVQAHGTQRQRWIPIHKLIWIEHHGPIPPKHVVRFKDGNPGATPADVVIENLECISMVENMRRNSIQNLPEAVVDVIQQRGRLNREINRQRRAHEKQY